MVIKIMIRLIHLAPEILNVELREIQFYSTSKTCFSIKLYGFKSSFITNVFRHYILLNYVLDNYPYLHLFLCLENASNF